MTKTMTVTLTGGFHDSADLRLRVAYEADGDYTLSESQAKRADRHFCGIDSCTCGGAARAAKTVTY